MTPLDFWTPFYGARYLADTKHLDLVHHGAYLLLLIQYWAKGPLPDDDAELARIVGTDLRTWRKIVAPKLRPFFTTKDGKLHQKRADIELARQADISAKRRGAANARHHPDDANAPANASARAGPDPCKPDANAPANAGANGLANAGANAPHTVPINSTDLSTGDSKKGINKNPLSSSSRARVSPVADGLDAVLSEAGVEPPEPGSAVVIPLRADRTEEPSADPLVSAHIKRVARAIEMRIPYGEVRSIRAQLDALEEQPAAVGADVTMGLRWRPVDPVRTVEEQLAILRGGP